MSVGLVLVSHSKELAQGLADVARQMAPSVTIVPAGGTDDGGIGTSFDLISAAVFRFFAWLDMQIPGRWPKIIVGALLGIVAYFAIPILMGLFGL